MKTARNLRHSFSLPSLVWVLSIVWLCSCTGSAPAGEVAATPDDKELILLKDAFGRTADGTPVDLYTLSNGNGMTVKITNYGGIITSLLVPDKNGVPGDIVLGFDSLSSYLAGHPHFGPIIGRYSGHIAQGRFSLDGETYTLATNAGAHHLHGGRRGFDKAVWEAEEVRADNAVGLRLNYISPDGEEGYPGTLTSTVTYTLSRDNALQIDFQATTDKKTLVNLTNHSYFNLSGGLAEDVLQHELQIQADQYAVVDKGMIPTGELREVRGTPADFTQPTPIGARMEQVPGGYDHNFVLRQTTGDGAPALAASVYEPLSGRRMEVYTTRNFRNSLEFASANWLNGSHQGKEGRRYGKSAGFLLYPQNLPNSPNQPEFPSAVLEPGQAYAETSIYRFSAQEPVLTP
jgi:aldose 1-epimerase